MLCFLFCPFDSVNGNPCMFPVVFHGDVNGNPFFFFLVCSVTA